MIYYFCDKISNMTNIKVSSSYFYTLNIISFSSKNCWNWKSKNGLNKIRFHKITKWFGVGYLESTARSYILFDGCFFFICRRKKPDLVQIWNFNTVCSKACLISIECLKDVARYVISINMPFQTPFLQHSDPCDIDHAQNWSKHKQRLYFGPDIDCILLAQNNFQFFTKTEET